MMEESEGLNARMPDTEAILFRVQRFVASDINSHFKELVSIQVKPTDVYVLYFHRVLNHWKTVVSTYALEGIYYEITYDGGLDVAIANVYTRRRSTPAVI